MEVAQSEWVCRIQNCHCDTRNEQRRERRLVVKRRNDVPTTTRIQKIKEALRRSGKFTVLPKC